MTLDQELNELRAKFEEKETQLRREHEILSVFGDSIAGYEKPQVSFYRLYGRRGSVIFRLNRYECLRNGKNPDAALLVTLLTRFPGEPIVKYKDSCLSFRLKDHAEEAAKIASEKGLQVDLYDCGPVTVKLEPAQYSQTATFKWCTRIGEELWEINLEFALWQTDLGQMNLQYKTYRDGEIQRVERCDFHPHAPWQKIKYASGNPKTPNSFVLFMDPDSAKETDYTQYLKKSS